MVNLSDVCTGSHDVLHPLEWLSNSLDTMEDRLETQWGDTILGPLYFPACSDTVTELIHTTPIVTPMEKFHFILIIKRVLYIVYLGLVHQMIFVPNLTRLHCFIILLISHWWFWFWNISYNSLVGKMTGEQAWHNCNPPNSILNMPICSSPPAEVRPNMETSHHSQLASMCHNCLL